MIKRENYQERERMIDLIENCEKVRNRQKNYGESAKKLTSFNKPYRI